MFGVVGHKVQVLVGVRVFFLYTVDFTLPPSFLVNFASKKGMLLFSSSSRVKMMLPVGSTVFTCCCNFFAFPVCSVYQANYIVHISFPVSRLAIYRCCGYYFLLQVLHVQVDNNGGYRTAHGYSKFLLVNFSFKSEVCRLQDKFQQLHDVVYL